MLTVPDTGGGVENLARNGSTIACREEYKSPMFCRIQVCIQLFFPARMGFESGDCSLGIGFVAPNFAHRRRNVVCNEGIQILIPS